MSSGTIFIQQQPILIGSTIVGGEVEILPSEDKTVDLFLLSESKSAFWFINIYIGARNTIFQINTTKASTGIKYNQFAMLGDNIVYNVDIIQQGGYIELHIENLETESIFVGFKRFLV